MKRITVTIAILITLFTTALKAQDAKVKKDFNATLTAYFEAKNGLAKDNPEAASLGAKNLLSSLATVSVKGLTKTQQEAWKTQSSEIKKAAELMVNEKDIKTQRKNFWTVSTAMTKLVKAVQINSSAVYVQYCPMAKKGWLNEVEAIQNPFYGKMMYDCGEVTETIAKK